MIRLFTTILLIISIQSFSQKNDGRHKYDVKFENALELNHLDFDNYLIGKIKTIKLEKFIYENGAQENGLTLNTLYKTYYNQKGELKKIEHFNTSRDLNFTILNFGKGFDFWINTKNNIEIDSISKKIKKTDIENGNQTTIYHLDSNYEVNSIDNSIGDSLRLYYFNKYDKNKLISEIYRNDSRFYTWNKDNQLQNYTRVNNSEKFKPNLKQAPEYVLEFKYRNDTIFLDEKSNDKLTKYKSINKNNIILPIYESNEIGTKTYFYNQDYSLYKMIYSFKDKSKIIYNYKLDIHGNWLQRFDNNKEVYSRKMTYDKYGNWITSEVYETGRKTEKIIREINYYE